MKLACFRNMLLHLKNKHGYIHIDRVLLDLSIA
jgi:hypothetical protein